MSLEPQTVANECSSSPNTRTVLFYFQIWASFLTVFIFLRNVVSKTKIIGEKSLNLPVWIMSMSIRIYLLYCCTSCFGLSINSLFCPMKSPAWWTDKEERGRRSQLMHLCSFLGCNTETPCGGRIQAEQEQQIQSACKRIQFRSTDGHQNKAATHIRFSGCFLFWNFSYFFILSMSGPKFWRMVTRSCPNNILSWSVW